MTPKKKTKIDEGWLDTLIGSNAASSFRSMGTSGMSTQAQRVYDNFIEDFIGDAVSSLKAGIKGGYIDTSIRKPEPSTDVKTSGETPKTEPSTDVKTGGETPPPEKPNLTPMQQAQQGTRPLTPQERNIARQQKKAGIVPSGQKMTPKQMNIARSSRLKESQYEKLNKIFESIIEATGGQSISDYMKTWFEKYMNGVDWEKNESIIMPMILNIENTYEKDRGYGAIKKLANAAFAIAKQSDRAPEGAKNMMTSTPASSSRESPDQIIRNVMKNFNDDDLVKLRKEIDKKVGTAKTESITRKKR